jgi:alpha-L-rhamnosidase
MRHTALSVTLLLLGALSVLPAASQPGDPPSRVWLGQWIWTDGDPAPRNSYTCFRKTFQLDSVPKEARIHLTADSRYHVYVNGIFAGRGPVRSDRRWLYYDTWDVAEHLEKGKNVVAVLVHHYGETTFQYMQGRGGLIADIVGFAGKSLARSEGTWKALRSEAWSSEGPRMSLQLAFNEVFDSRKEPKGWREPAFDDSSWPAARVIGPAGMEPWPNLVSRDIPAMRRAGAA